MQYHRKRALCKPICIVFVTYSMDPAWSLIGLHALNESISYFTYASVLVVKTGKAPTFYKKMASSFNGAVVLGYRIRTLEALRKARPPRCFTDSI